MTDHDHTPAVFFDDGRGLLDPFRDLRPIFDTRTGALTIIDRLSRSLGLEPVALFARPEHAAITAEAHALPVNTLPQGPGSVLLVNGRCPLPLDVLENLAPGRAVVEAASGDLVAAMTDRDTARAILSGAAPPLDTLAVEGRVLMTRPWHARTFRDASIAIDLAILGSGPNTGDPDGCCLIGDGPLRVAPGAAVHPACVLDTSKGPIVIDEGAVVRPRATIIGPASIGPGSTIVDGALIKANTAIGPVCKVAGEVGGTVFQGYSNKAHEGHLGDAWIGEWVNLGAGTTNSNLLNTYGEVTAVPRPGEPRERTGETFLGCVLGDHVKTAICTRIMTGAIVHTGAMWAASAPVAGCVGRFEWVTDAGVRHYRIDKFLEVMHAAMARRNVRPSPAQIEQLTRLAAL